MATSADDGDLFLTRDKDNLCFVFSPIDQNRWRASRVPQLKKESECRDVLLQTPSGDWVVEERGPKAGPDSSWRRLVPSEAVANGSPLGVYKRPDDGSTFQMRDISSASSFASPTVIKKDFVTVIFESVGDVWKMENTFHNVTVTDAKLGELLAEVKDVLMALARRPYCVLFIYTSAQNAAVAGMTQIKQFMNWIHNEAGIFMYTLCRGHAIILKPTGYFGMAVLNLIKMVQRLMPPPWPDAIVPSADAAVEFMRPLRKEYEDLEVARRKRAGIGSDDSDISAQSTTAPSAWTNSIAPEKNEEVPQSSPRVEDVKNIDKVSPGSPAVAEDVQSTVEDEKRPRGHNVNIFTEEEGTMRVVDLQLEESGSTAVRPCGVCSCSLV